jgi:hypothetical protein
MICSDNFDYNQLLEISQRLDKLILEEVKKNIYVKNVLGDECLSELDIVIDKIQLFEEMYDSMRIVDPVKKEVLELKKDILCKTNSECYKLLV